MGPDIRQVTIKFPATPAEPALIEIKVAALGKLFTCSCYSDETDEFSAVFEDFAARIRAFTADELAEMTHRFRSRHFDENGVAKRLRSVQ